MGWRDRFGYWLGQLNRSRAKKELGEEIQLHLELEIRTNLECGMSAEEARRQALRRFGNPERYREESYQASGMARVDGWLRDLAYAFRMLRKRPLFTILVAGILALGIGTSTAVFSVVEGVLLRPLPFREPSRLVTISAANENRGWDGFPIPQGAFQAFRAGGGAISEAAAFEPAAYTWVGGPEPLRLRGAAVSPNFFGVLGVGPFLGRLFGSDGPTVGEVIISDRLWKGYFGGDPSILGKTMRLDGAPHSVVGVLPPEFAYPDPETEIWLPLPQAEPGNLWSRWSLRCVARLAPGSSVAAARGEIAALTSGFAENLPFGAGWRFPVARLEDELLGEVRAGLWILLASVGLVLVIASLNVAAICLARTRDRAAELTMRSVLGASRWTLVRQLLIEHLLLAVAGAVAGVLLAAAFLRAILFLSPARLPRLETVSLDFPTLLFALALTLFSGLVAASLPALAFGRLQATAVLGSGFRTPISVGSGSRARRLLVVAQVSAVTILLVVAGLMVRSFLGVVGVDFGMRSSGVLAVSVELAKDRYQQAAAWSDYFSTCLERIAEIPGVEAVGLTTGLPPRGVQSIDSSFRTEDQAAPVPRETATDAVSPSYFRAAGIPLLEGRGFSPNDGTPVAILNQKLAEAAFPGQDPVGKRMLASDDETWLTVVGVAGDVKQYGLDRETPLQIYRPFSQQPTSRAHLLVAVDRRRPELIDLVKQVLHRIDREQPLKSVAWMDALLAESVASRRFPALLLSAFALVSLVLALAGIYGMLSHVVSLRTREMGVRLAVGARRADLLRLVLAPALRLSLGGLAVGLAGAIAVTRFLESQLFGVEPLDLTSFAVAAALVPLASLLAAYLPARRAATTDPVSTLRQE